MSHKLSLNGVLIEDEQDPRNYHISKFIPNEDIIEDAEFMLKLPKLNIIMNQKWYGSCVAHSFILCKQILEYQQTNKWIDYDPYLLYGTRYADEYAGEGMYSWQGAKVLLKDGAFFRKDFGIEGEMPKIKERVEDWKSKHSTEVEAAKDFRINGYSYVYNSNEIKKALKNGMPVSATYPLYDSFYSVSSDGKVKNKQDNDTLRGYHQMTIVGWTTDNYWIVVNSWGTGKGFRGMYFIPMDYVYNSAIAVSDTIFPSKYKAEVITFKIGCSTYTVDGNPMEFDSIPFILNNRTMVPIRFITEALGASVEWLNESKTCIVRSEEAVIRMQINNKTLTINEKNTKTLDVAPIISYSRTMVPIRAIAEILNCKVDWHRSGKITISAL